MGFFITCYWTPVAPFVSLEALCIGIVIVVTVLVAVLFIKLKKRIILSQRNTCVCCGNTSGKTVDSGLSLISVDFVKWLWIGSMLIFRCCFLFCVDEKSHDALLVSYKSHTEAGMIDLHRQCIKRSLEDWFGYAVYDCGVFRGTSTHVRCSVINTDLKQWNQ